ncbi:MAG: hypothetical protein ABIA75_10260 [Candidatus Neomarinimicrobiota bacterium]
MTGNRPNQGKSAAHDGRSVSGFVCLIALLLLLAAGCDFQSPADFETPTWYMDLTIPLVQERYPFSNMVNGEEITVTDDSLGMQVVFDDSLPGVSIDPSYLQIQLNQNIAFSQDPVYAPDMDFSFDTVLTVEIPFAPNGEFLDVSGATFTVPSASDHDILASLWNAIAAAFDTTIILDIDIPQVDESDLPEFIASIEAIEIVADSDSDSSLFQSTIINNGLPTAVKDIEFSLSTDTSSPPDTLARHVKDRLLKDSTYSEYTLLGDSQLGTRIRMTVGFSLEEETVLDTITIKADDSVKVNLSFRIRIAGIDQAVVQIVEYDLAPEIDPVSFPSDIEIFSGVFTDPSPPFSTTNEIRVTNLRSTFLFDINFSMNFRNFLPPEGEDTVKVETVLSRSAPAYARTFDVDGYRFANPDDTTKAMSAMDIAVSAVIPAQTATIPLDGSEFGRLTLGVGIDSLHFESLKANLVREFPSVSQEMTGMPRGFTGMAFTDVKIEITMLNQIQLPVFLDIDMIGVNVFGDSMLVGISSNLGTPTSSSDTIKTVIRLSRDGTTTIVYDSPGAVTYDPADSVTVAPGPGESNIVDLLSFNPETMVFSSSAKIDGRGTITIGAAIWGSFRLIAPFEVRMAPMTFIPVNESPIEEWDYEMRNRIRSALRSSSTVARVVNSFPVGGEISMLLSNQAYFPLDLSQESLDSLAVAMGYEPSNGDSIYYVSECAAIDPALDSTIYIFDLMSDFSECTDGVVYLVRSTGSGVDTLIAYVDTLLSIVLPDPELNNYDSDLNDEPRLVGQPGDYTSASILTPETIRLLTSPGQHFTAPRIHLNGSPIDPVSGDTLPVFISLEDYIDIKSYMTFEISSTGVMEPAPPELVLTYPNGGEVINVLSPIIIRWKTFGKVKKVDLDYSIVSNPDIEDEEDWTPLESNWIAVANVDSFVWNAATVIQDIPGAQRDSVRIRVSATGSDATDMSGWYFTLMEVLRSVVVREAVEPPVINKPTKDRR